MIKNRSVKNASWIIFCKIVQSLFSLVVTMLSARYLGPSNYGLINYAASLTTFVVPIMQLGLRNTLVQEIINYPDKEGETLGTAITLNLISSIATIIGIISFVSIANRGETDTLIVCSLYSLCLIFQALEMSQYWFQAKLFSKYTSLTMLGAYIIVSIYKIYLLMTGKNVYLFAISQTIDYLIISVVLIIIYYKIGTQKLSFSFKRGKELLSKSRYYIVSSLMVTIFTQTDKIMLKLMIGDESIGYYSAASACAGMTAFIFAAIIDSFRPTIFENKKRNEKSYKEDITILYSIIIYFALIQCIVITLFSGLIVQILYGSSYSESVSILRIIVWVSTFSYLGSVRNIWILAEGKHKVLWIINLSGAVSNVIFNLILIPVMGATGAALASLITQFFTNVITGYIIPAIRPNNKLMVSGLNPKNLYKVFKMFKS